MKTRGVTDLDLGFETPYAWPLHPREELSDWRDEDRRRRGLAEVHALRLDTLQRSTRA